MTKDSPPTSFAPSARSHHGCLELIKPKNRSLVLNIIETHDSAVPHTPPTGHFGWFRSSTETFIQSWEGRNAEVLATRCPVPLRFAPHTGALPRVQVPLVSVQAWPGCLLSRNLYMTIASAMPPSIEMLPVHARSRLVCAPGFDQTRAPDTTSVAVSL